MKKCEKYNTAPFPSSSRLIPNMFQNIHYNDYKHIILHYNFLKTVKFPKFLKFVVIVG